MRIVSAVAIGAAIGISSFAAEAGDRILSFDTMVGVAGQFLAPTTVGGLRGGGRPWVLEEGTGKLDDDGRLRVKVSGLIIPASEGPQFGINPVAFFRAAVSCSLGNGEYLVTLTNNGPEVMIGDPRNGDARIDERLELPAPCVGPIVFVTNNAGTSWFAATGSAGPSEEDVAQSGRR